MTPDLYNAVVQQEGFSTIIGRFINDLDIPVVQYNIMGQEVWKWFTLLLAVIVGILFKRCLAFIIERIQYLSNRTSNHFDDLIISSTKNHLAWAIVFIFWYLCAINVGLSQGLKESLVYILKVLLFYQAVSATYSISKHTAEFIKIIAQSFKLNFDKSLVAIVSRTIRAIIIILAPLVALQNLGVNIMSLMAGLGLGGLAFALAAKDTASNLFGSLMILIDQPFRQGDWILVSGAEGTVEEIGLRSTRIRTFYDSMVTVPNSDIASTCIDNMGQRKYRRIKTTLGLTYETSPEQIEAFLEAIKTIIEAHPNTRKDYYQVVFTEFGASSLEILLYFFIQVEDWSRELVVKQNIFLDIIRAANELRVNFAFPTTTLHIDSYTDEKQKEPEKPIDELKNIALSYKQKSMPKGAGLYEPLFEKLSNESK